jgi:uncharacterized protein
MSTLEHAPPPPIPGAVMPRTIGIGWIVLGIVLAILVVPAVLGGIAFVIAGDPENDVALIVAQAFFAAGLVAVPIFLLRALHVTPVAGRLGVRKFRFWSGIGWMFAAYGLFFVFALVYGLVVRTDTEQQVLQDIAAEKDTAILVAQGILVIVFAPISEELFFRGFLFGGLRGRMTFWPAALVSGVFFGLIHLLGGSWEVIAPLAAFGVLLAWLYERTGSLGPPILMHAIQNSIAFTVTVAGA